MSFAPSTDKYPVLFGSDGLPLPLGSYLEYFEIGTNNPKTVYSDVGRTTPLDQPVLVGADHRTSVQVYLGYGQYTVIATKYNGDGVDFSDPLDYSVDHQWDEQGLEAAPSPIGEPAVQVETVAVLRTVDPDSTNYVSLMGYWAAGDKPVLTYRWVANSLADDDLGYVIRNPLEAVGAWHADTPAEVNVKDYGVIGTAAGTATATHLQAAITYAYLTGKQLYLPNQTIQIPNTVGSVVFTCDVRTDDNAAFRCLDGGTLYVVFAKGFKRNAFNSMQSIDGDGGLCQFIWSGGDSTPINPQWIGINYSAPGTQDSLLQPFLSGQVGDTYPIVVDGPLWLASASADMECYNKLIFTGNGYIRNDSSYYFTFGEYENHMTPEKAMISGAGSGWYIRNRGKYFRSSWVGGKTGTANMQTWVNYQAGGTHIILDAATNYIDGSIVTTGLKWTVEPQCVVTNPGNQFITIPGDFNGSPQCLTQRYWVFSECQPRASWFTSINNALSSAWSSSAVLDLESSNYTMTAQVTLPSTTVSKFGIKDGSITNTSGSCMAIPGTCSDFSLRNVEFQGANTLMTVSGTLYTATVTNCVTNSTTFLTVSGTLGMMTVSGSYMVHDTLVAYSTGSIGKLLFSNNPLIKTAYCKPNDGAKFMTTGTNWEQNGSGSELILNTGSTATACTFTGIQVKYRSEGATLSCVHSNNFHISSTGYLSYLKFLVDQTNTQATGIIVTGNTWQSAASVGTGPFDMVSYVIGFGTWGANSFHRINISGNEGDDLHDQYVRQTKGSKQVVIAAAGNTYVRTPLSNFFIVYDTDNIPRVAFNSATFEFAWLTGEPEPPTGVNVRYLARSVNQFDNALIWRLDGNLSTQNYVGVVQYDFY